MTATSQTESFSFRWGIPLDEVGHTPVPNWMFDYYAEAGVRQGEFLLILHLARYAYERPGTVCCPSVETLAAQLGVTPRALRQRLRAMEARGLLERQYRPGETTVYDFTPFSERVRGVKGGCGKNGKGGRDASGVIRQASLLAEGLPTEAGQGEHWSGDLAQQGSSSESWSGDLAQQGSSSKRWSGDLAQHEGAEGNCRGTPEEFFRPPRKVFAPKEQKEEEKGKKTTTRTSSDTLGKLGGGGEGGGGAVAFSNFEEKKDAARVTSHASRVMRHTSRVMRDTSGDTDDASRVTHDVSREDLDIVHMF